MCVYLLYRYPHTYVIGEDEIVWQCRIGLYFIRIICDVIEIFLCLWPGLNLRLPMTNTQGK